MKKWLSLLLATVLFLLPGCVNVEREDDLTQAVYSVGFGKATLAVPQNSEQPLYIAGYHSGREITGILDKQQVRTLWLDDGTTSVLLIVVDCIGLGSGTVEQIRLRLTNFCQESGCDSVNVISTHTHAGVDTLGLWGPAAVDGKNDDFMKILMDGAVTAAEAAYADRSPGKLTYSVTSAEGLQEDSRAPEVYDDHLYQLRFVPEKATNNGIRVLSFGAHAESLRGDNTLLSRDYPGAVCDLIEEETGDDAIFLPGAIGGLIMTPELTGEIFDAQQNLRLTAQRIADLALSAPEGKELTASIQVSRVSFETELENTLFLYYKFLGILENEVRKDLSGTYWLRTELTALQLGEVTLALLPGEIFPELVTGTGQDADPQSLELIAREYGIRELVVIGLANDEIGYIVPPSDYVLDEQLPFFQEAEGDHYEETNSVGRDCAIALAQAFEQALGNICQ